MASQFNRKKVSFRLKITHTKNNVIQYSEYYPFGLQTGNSWTRSGATGNNFLYNSASELNQTSGWYEMFFRGYDPAIGRMLQIDPYAHAYGSFSPFSYAVNNPINLNDPSGGTVAETAQYIEDNYIRWGGIGRDGQGGGGSPYDWQRNMATIESQRTLEAAKLGDVEALEALGGVTIRDRDAINQISNALIQGVGISITNEGIQFNDDVLIQGGRAVIQYGGQAILSTGNRVISKGTLIELPKSGQAQQGGSKRNGGFDWFFGAEGAATAGWENFALELKNIGGFDYKRDARDWRVTSSTKYGGNRPASPNNATIDRTSFSAGYGATIQKNKDIVNGVQVFTESYTVGWEALGIQVNFDSMQNVTDIRFGVDTGVSFAIFGGLEVSLQAGGIYVFE